MSKAFDRLSRQGLFCTAPVGVVGRGSLDLAGAPAPGELASLIIAAGLFLFAGYWVFARWGKTASKDPIGAAMPGLAR